MTTNPFKIGDSAYLAIAPDRMFNSYVNKLVKVVNVYGDICVIKADTFTVSVKYTCLRFTEGN